MPDMSDLVGPEPTRSAEFYERVVEQSSDTTIVFDEVGTITYASAAVRHLVGRPPAEVVGTNITDYLEPEEIGLAVEGMAWAHEHPSRPDLQTEIHFRIDGTRRAHDVRGTLWVEDDGTSRSVVSLRDTFSVQVMGEILESVMRSDPIEQSLTLIAELAHDVLRRAGVAIRFRLGDHDEPRVVLKALPVGVLEAWSGAPSCDTVEGAVLPPGEPDRFACCWSRPLVLSDGRDVGCLALWNQAEDDMGPYEQTMTDRLAQMASFAIDRYVKDRAVSLAASRDPLTDLANRSHFISSYGATTPWSVGHDDGCRTAVLLVDLDDFKPVNDRYGHLAGDHVLVTIAERLRRVVRSGDVAARLGGDEFAVLCPSVSTSDVVAIAQRIVEVIEQPITFCGGTTIVGVSIGIAFGDDEDDDLDALLGRADGALYSAKRAGKRRFVIAGARSRPREGVERR